MTKPRYLHNTHWGMICPSETPEGQSIGLVKNLSITSEITLQYSSEPIRHLLEDKIIHFTDIEICGNIFTSTTRCLKR